MNFSLKDIKASAGITFSRAIQFTGEKLGNKQKTELDQNLENLLSQADLINSWNEKILSSIEVLVQPNLTSRVEDFIIEKLAVPERRSERLSNLDWLGSDMLSFGENLSPGDTYGSALTESGQTELIVGQVEREFTSKLNVEFIKPLKRLLTEKTEALSRERRRLDLARLDLDAAKSKHAKIYSTEEPNSMPYVALIKELNQVKDELEIAQIAFDKQVTVIQDTAITIINSKEYTIKDERLIK